MKPIRFVVFVAVLAAGPMATSTADAGDQGRGKGPGNSRKATKVEPQRVVVTYFGLRDVQVIREYYRPFYQPLPPGLEKKYYRTGTLPPGWQKKMHALPLRIERDLYVLPAGYHRGVIDGRAVVYNSKGVIVDIAVLF